MATTKITTEMFRAAVGAAVRAPSMYNAQPWRFALSDGRIRVGMDPVRLLPVADPNRWAARLACGAAVASIQLALAVDGVATEVDLTADPNDDLLVATVTAIGPHTPTPRERALHAAIPVRHSDRRPFVDVAVPTAARTRMVAAARNAGASLVLTDDRASVARIAEIIREADERLHRDAAYVAELREWVGRHEVDSAGIAPEEAGVVPAGHDVLALRDFGGPPRAPGRDFETDPLVGVLTHSGSGRIVDTTAGIALLMVLLTATDERLATSMLSQPIEVSEMREELRRVLGVAGQPHMVLRVGYGQPKGPSDRRGIDSVIDTSGRA